MAEAAVEIKENIVQEAVTTKEEVIEAVESESVKKTSTNPSEYDSADSFSDVPQENAPENETALSEHSDGSEGSEDVTFEREEGDGQESAQSKKVDDDEDKKNPQYIPKRGTFYEHDDRTAEDNEEEKKEDEKATEKEGKKKIWTDKKEKWSHDKFNDNDQAPKSRQELIAIYGYDIRNEDGPPRARRRRRYGRGPNKYTRNWEDEDAYNKATPVVKKTPIKKTNVKPRGQQDSKIENDNAASVQSEEANSSGRQSTESSAEYSRSEKPHPTPKPREFTPRNSNSSNTERYNNKNQRVGTGRIVKPNRDVRDSDYKGFTKPRQFTKSYTNDETNSVQSRNFTNKKHADIEKDMARLALNDSSPHNKNAANHQAGSNKQGGVPPRLQSEQKGSKRYSSIRQRSLPDSANGNFNQQQSHNFYANEFQSQQQPNQLASNQPPQPPQPLIQSMQSQMPAIPPPPLPSIPQQVPVTTTPLPPQYANPFPQPQQFLQPAPPPFIPQQSAPILNYVQGQPQYPPPTGAFQGYQQPFNPVSQPTEIFQPHGGITYYSAQEQQAAQRAAIQKRPKAAIPIVPPPPLEPRGRGRMSQENQMASPGAPENNAEVLVEKPAAHYEDAAPVLP